MDLFTPVIDPALFHPNFKAALHDSSSGERDVLTDWAQGFVDRDNKFVHEFQSTFNTAYWELYLHAVFRELRFNIDWTYDRPDFNISKEGIDIAVEATSAGAADGKPKEWERILSPEVLKGSGFNIPAINHEAIIRISNSIAAKHRKYKESYHRLRHVAGRPFVVAIGPFEQPYFYLQYDRPIKAVLYDYYVDEEAYKQNPSIYPKGPPAVSLGAVKKDNGAEIKLGVFNSPEMEDISAVIFSCTATWGKLDALTKSSRKQTIFNCLRYDNDGVPQLHKGVKREEYSETLLDGLQVYHNSFAKNPIPPSLFRGKGIVQNYFDEENGVWVHEGIPGALIWRMAIGIYAGEQIK